ncbi:MAG: ABC-F family ATP-binding cassette domain-containing protein [Clostridia bacterium]|nr:ABC-F family ATP-binding cassette domain-containing protein [Clostridia bacterium]
MIALSVSDVSLSFGTDVVLKNISFAVNDGDKVGIVGVNGAGKTSLFKVIDGRYTPDTGAVYVQKGHTVGVLDQNPDLTALPRELTCLEYMYTAHPDLLRLEAEIKALEDRLAYEKSPALTLSLSEELIEKNRVFAARGGLEFRSRCRGMLLRLGFDEQTINRRTGTLSGGQYTRLSLARLLATEPDVLMLDEPTNHLDIDAVMWLESFLLSYKKTVIIISHDRYFLDRITNKTLHIQYALARLYPGNYSASKAQMEAEAASLEKRYKEQQKEIAKIRANIEFQRRCNREHNFVTIRSKEKQLARMEKIELAPKAPKDIRLSFNAEEESTNDVLEVKDVSFGYGDKEIIKNLSFLVRRYERVMVLGPNGSGKSTLMKLINSLIIPSKGKISLGYNIKIGYYDQENRGLSLEKTVFEQMRDDYPDKTNLELRSTLALFLFGPDDIDKQISTLSGGERARLTLARLILKKVNLLVMDEPTNHLDIGSADALEHALAAFDGTIVAVSHDRYFINRIATRIIELDPTMEKGMHDFVLDDGDDAFSEYAKLREIRRQNIENAAPVLKNTDSRASYEQMKKENALRRSNEKKIERAKEKIEKLECELVALDEELFGSAASDYVRAAEIDARKGEIEEELLSLYELVM